MNFKYFYQKLFKSPKMYHCKFMKFLRIGIGDTYELVILVILV